MLYPRDPTRPGVENHRLFALTIAPLSQLPPHMKALRSKDEAEAAFRAAVADMIAERKPRLLLQSSETMLSISIREEYGDKLRASLDALGAHPKFTAYVRRRSQHYLSDMQQVLLLRAKPRQPRPPRYKSKIRPYEKAFGRRRVLLHLYDSTALAGGDVVVDFCAPSRSVWSRGR